MDQFIRRIRVHKVFKQSSPEDNQQVKDGDTLVGDIELGYGLPFEGQVFRLYGCNAWETSRRGSWDNGLSEEEVLAKIALGKEAEKILEREIELCGKDIWIQSMVSPDELQRKGKYGRWLVKLFLKRPGEDKPYCWNDWLIENGYGYVYMED